MKLMSITFITSCFFLSCNLLKIHHKKGAVLVRIVNIESVKTSGYFICNKKYPGLEPLDTSQYQSMKVFDWSGGISVIIGRDTLNEHVISDCWTCWTDSSQKITIKVKIINRDTEPEVYSDWDDRKL